MLSQEHTDHITVSQKRKDLSPIRSCFAKICVGVHAARPCAALCSGGGAIMAEFALGGTNVQLACILSLSAEGGETKSQATRMVINKKGDAHCLCECRHKHSES